jgi:hypothetical protein
MKARTILSATLLLSGALAGCSADVSPEGHVEPGAPAIRVDNQQGGGGTPTGIVPDTQAINVSGDFNGDGVGDLIVVTNRGSFEYLGSKSGGFTGGAWSDSNRTLGHVTYTVGDFNGDHASDIIITDSSGSYLYTGQFGASGGFNVNVAFDMAMSLSLGSVNYTVGDFDGNGKSDVIITQTSGSYECLYVDAGGFFCPSFLQPIPWVDASLTLRQVKFAAGDFNGDGFSDLVYADATGAHELTGTKSGQFNIDVWTDSSLTFIHGFSQIELVPGDFNGDGTTDLIVATSAGSTEYQGKFLSGFTNVWSRPDLTASATQYFPGDFNGDLLGDVIIQTTQGAFEYTGKFGGGFNVSSWARNDLSVGSTSFWPSDYNGDGVTDLLVITTSGTNEFTGNRTGAPFTTGVWVRPDLALNAVQYF